MLEGIVVAALVAVSAVLAARKLYRQLKGEEACSACHSGTCSLKNAANTRISKPAEHFATPGNRRPGNEAPNSDRLDN